MRGVPSSVRLPPPLRRLASRGGPLPPLALLLLALASVFAFGHDRGYFYRPGHHDFITAQTMTVAANLTPDDGFQMCRRRKLLPDGEPSCAFSHNAYPLAPFALTRLAAEAAGGGPARRLYAARLLTLAFFAGAALLAQLALARLLADRWIAAAAALFAFSSYYLLHYADMVAFQVTALFGVMLTFHGMAVFASEGRFLQLALKTAVALALGWHAAALAAPFVLIGLGGELARARREGGPRPYARRAASALARSPYLAYGALAALCLALALGWAFANEYAASGGAPTDLRVFDALARRSGFASGDQDFAQVGWWRFLAQQLGAPAAAAIPYLFVDLLDLGLPAPRLGYWPGPWYAVPGAVLLAACLAGLRRLPHRAPLAALLLAGWCWALPLRGSVVLHEYEAAFHLGAALTLGALAAPALRRLPGGGRAAPAIALAAAALFVLSAWRTADTGLGAEAAQRERVTAADFEAIRPRTDGASVVAGLIDEAFRSYTKDFLQMRNYWLAGSYAQIEGIGSEQAWREAQARGFEYVVLLADLGGSLTLDNERFFLYRLGALPAVRDAAAAGPPALRARFGLRLGDGALTWTREGCGGGDTEPGVFLDVVPLDARDLPADRRAAGFERRSGAFSEYGVRFGGDCVARFALPDYPIAGVRTGQRHGALVLWEASLPAADVSFPRRASTWRDGIEAAGAPALSSAFDVRLDREARTLTYVREACSPADAEARFFLHVVPLDAADLPEERRAPGFDNLDFAFADRGLRYDGACLARVALPEYAIASVATGQFEGARRLWEGEIAFGD